MSSFNSLHEDGPIMYLNRRYATGLPGSIVEYVEIPSGYITVMSPLIEDMIQHIKADASSKGLEFRTLLSIGPIAPITWTRKISYTAEYNPLKQWSRANGPFADDFV